MYASCATFASRLGCRDIPCASPGRRSALLDSHKAARVFNPLFFNRLRTLFYPERGRRACPELMRGVSTRSISFLFMLLRTLFSNGAIATSFSSITSALFPVQRGMGVSSLTMLIGARSSPPAAFLCFQQLTNCPICKPFILITMQQWGGCGGTPFSIFSFPFSVCTTLERP